MFVISIGEAYMLYWNYYEGELDFQDFYIRNFWRAIPEV